MKPRTLMYGIAISAALALASLPLVAQVGGAHRHYRVISLGVPLGGSASSTAAINDQGWIAGTSNLTGDLDQHAVLWIYGFALDLGTLGGPNSSVLWPGVNELGQTVGISDTAHTDPYGESWSCGAFLPASHQGHTCVGFLWQWGRMTALPTLGGNNGFATGIDNHGQAVGWAENTVHDPTCVAPQVLQFEAVTYGPQPGQIQELQPYGTDPDGAATDINDLGDVVGISGICQFAVGDQSATHALLWHNGTPIDLGNLGGTAWNTPMAINNQDVIVGFSDLSGDQNGNNPNFHAFLWRRPGPMQDLGTLSGDAISEALGINQQGQTVGVSFAAGFTSPRAFLYENGTMVDLNTLAPDSPLYLQVAQDINDSGVIAGMGCTPGNCSATSPMIAFVAIPMEDGNFAASEVASSRQAPPAENVAPKQLLHRMGLDHVLSATPK